MDPVVWLLIGAVAGVGPSPQNGGPSDRRLEANTVASRPDTPVASPVLPQGHFGKANPCWQAMHQHGLLAGVRTFGDEFLVLPQAHGVSFPIEERADLILITVPSGIFALGARPPCRRIGTSRVKRAGGEGGRLQILTTYYRVNVTESGECEWTPSPAALDQDVFGRIEAFWRHGTVGADPNSREVTKDVILRNCSRYAQLKPGLPDVLERAPPRPSRGANGQFVEVIPSVRSIGSGQQ